MTQVNNCPTECHSSNLQRLERLITTDVPRGDGMKCNAAKAISSGELLGSLPLALCYDTCCGTLIRWYVDTTGLGKLASSQQGTAGWMIPVPLLLWCAGFHFWGKRRSERRRSSDDLMNAAHLVSSRSPPPTAFGIAPPLPSSLACPPCRPRPGHFVPVFTLLYLASSVGGLPGLGSHLFLHSIPTLLQ